MLRLRVFGKPAPQGSKRHVGRGIMVESSKAVAPWREAVKWAAIEARNGLGPDPLSGPLSMQVVFLLPRPKRIRQPGRQLCDRMPDASKLLRSTEDALTDAGAWCDDAQVVHAVAWKLYHAEDEAPGAEIVVDRVQAFRGVALL